MIGGNSDKPPACPHTATLERNSSSFSLQAQVSAFKTADSRKKLRAKQPQQLRWLASTLGPSCSLPSTVARASRPVLYGVTAAVWESSWKVLLSRLPLRHNLAGCRGQQRWPYRRRSFLLSHAPHVGQLSIEATTAQQVPGCCLQLSTGGLLHARPCWPEWGH